MDRLRLTNDQKRILVELNSRIERTVDDLPYTDEFETLYTEFVARTGITMTRHDVWRALSSSVRPVDCLVRNVECAQPVRN